MVTNSAVKFADVTDYKGKPQELFADLYRPEGDSATNRPVAVLIHGGGFRTDGKRTQKYIVHFANELARRGFVAASIDYRQREGDDMPTAADELPALKDAAADALTALQWIRKHGGEYGYDPSKIFLLGGSAGGRIACAIACRENGDTGGLPESDKFSTTSPPSSVTSEKSADYDRAGLIAATILWGGPEPEYRCFTVDGGDLPCLFIHGTYDSLVPAEGSVSLHDKLAKAGVPTRLHLLNGYEHSLKDTESAKEDAKPRSAPWIADFFVREWQRKTSGGKSEPSVPQVVGKSGKKLVLASLISCQGFAPVWQWKLNGKQIPGATAATLTVENAGEEDGGLYGLTVSNPEGAWPKDAIASITIDGAPISAVEFRRGGKDGKQHTHPESITVPVAQVLLE
ncbi:MAG: alpha/beta hydrolase fold domain-containing protein [Chthoniobacterales bacterium]|nr:alpha/beta hydrolase fold domain-containing protein [Chthoniobacterales bacterium]